MGEGSIISISTSIFCFCASHWHHVLQLFTALLAMSHLSARDDPKLKTARRQWQQQVVGTKRTIQQLLAAASSSRDPHVDETAPHDKTWVAAASSGGCPLLRHGLTYLECQVKSSQVSHAPSEEASAERVKTLGDLEPTRTD